MSMNRREYIQGVTALAAAGVGPAIQTAQAANLPNLPETMIWTAYGIGAAGYVEASAVAEAFGKKYGTRIRLQPSGSSIGRIKPVMDGRASHGWLANELYFAMDALFEYAAPDTGPQNLRTLIGRANSLSIGAAADSGIKTVADLKGRKFAVAKSNTSIYAKTTPILAFAGLTWDDLDLVEYPSYGATVKALIEGKADAGGFAPSSASLRELEATRGINWMALPPENKDGWDRMKKVVPFVEPFQETVGAGLSDANPVWMLGYRYPMVTVRAETSADETYALTKAIAETFDMYKDVNKVANRWAVEKAGTPPMDAALHEGAIRYYKEIGQWKPEHQAWQDGMLKRHAEMKKAWDKLIAKTPGASSKSIEEMQAIWYPVRAEVLERL